MSLVEGFWGNLMRRGWIDVTRGELSIGMEILLLFINRKKK